MEPACLRSSWTWYVMPAGRLQAGDAPLLHMLLTMPRHAPAHCHPDDNGLGLSHVNGHTCKSYSTVSSPCLPHACLTVQHEHIHLPIANALLHGFHPPPTTLPTLTLPPPLPRPTQDGSLAPVGHAAHQDVPQLCRPGAATPQLPPGPAQARPAGRSRPAGARGGRPGCWAAGAGAAGAARLGATAAPAGTGPQ
jgi:hypothetical protein